MELSKDIWMIVYRYLHQVLLRGCFSEMCDIFSWNDTLNCFYVFNQSGINTLNYRGVNGYIFICNFKTGRLCFNFKDKDRWSNVCLPNNYWYSSGLSFNFKYHRACSDCIAIQPMRCTPNRILTRTILL